MIIGDDVAKINDRSSSIIPEKIAAIEEEEKHLMNYMEKLKKESKDWDEMLQNYAKSADVAKKFALV